MKRLSLFLALILAVVISPVVYGQPRLSSKAIQSLESLLNPDGTLNATNPHGTTLTQTNLTVTGTFDINNANPIVTLTDTDASSADLQIDVNANIAQIRAVGGAANSLISLNLSRNSIGIGNVPGTIGELLNLSKIATDPTIDSVPMGINSTLRYSGATTLGFMYGLLQNVRKEGAGNVTNMLGINCYATGNTGGGTITNLAIFNSDCSVVSGTTITRAQHFHVTPASGTGAITSEAGFQCPILTKGTNRVGFVYGLADGTLPTGVFAVYAATDPSFFGGNVGIGVTPISALDVNGNIRLGVDHQDNLSRFIGLWNVSTLGGNGTSGIEIRSSAPGSFSQSIYFWTHEYNVASGTPRMIIQYNGKVGIAILVPTATLHLGAGTATANTAPLKFTPGTPLTTAEVGAVEFVDDGTTGTLYITVNVAGVATRKAIAYQ